MEKFDVNITPENGETIIRNGEALPLREPENVNLQGTITSVSRFLANRFLVWEYSPAHCHVTINREGREIRLICNEKSYYQTRVTGRLVISPEYEKWQINSGYEFSAKELADFIKMNRSALPSKSVAMELASKLSNLKVTTNKELEKADNNRGEMRYAISQKVIENNIPEHINLSIPIFKGEEKSNIKVELYVNPASFDVQLVSPDAQEILDESVNAIMETEIDKINNITNNEIVIIEQ